MAKYSGYLNTVFIISQKGIIGNTFKNKTMNTNYFLETYSGKKLISRKKLEGMSKCQMKDKLDETNNQFLIDRENKMARLRKSKKELLIV